MSLQCDLVVVTQDKPRTRRAWHSSRSKVPRSRIPLSQPTAALTARPEPVSRRSASQPSAVLSASKRGESTKKQVVSAFFSRESPFYAPLTRFLAENWRFPGEDGFTTVYGTSGWQGLAHLPGSPAAGSLPCFYDSREKFVHFGSAQLGRARLVRARACRGQNSDFEKILCQNVRRDLEAFRRFYASETPILKKNRRNVFNISPSETASLDRRTLRNFRWKVHKISRKK